MKRRSSAIFFSLFICAGLGGCVHGRAEAASPLPEISCPAPLQPYLRTALYTGAIADTAWQRFMSEVLVQHFPAGGSVFENTGWWRRPDGTMYRNVGKTLVVLAPVTETESHRIAVRAVIAAIKHRFNHQSVGWEEGRLCAGF
jgi:hypothetical protein